MNSTLHVRPALDDVRIHVRFKLSALWASVMFCYIYADYFGLYVPGALSSMLAGRMEPLGAVSQQVLLGASLMLAIPSVMIFLSLALSPVLTRWLNIVCGVLYTLIILVTMWRWAFFVFYGIVEVALTCLAVWYASTWPRQNSAQPAAA